VTDRSEVSAIEQTRRELADKSRQLSELEVLLSDYHAERVQLVREIRHLQARLRDATEQSQPDLNQVVNT
jgi:predicted transcriptional regulator